MNNRSPLRAQQQTPATTSRAATSRGQRRVNRVLFVCTGNVCRSPSAELLFRRRCSDATIYDVTSAGMYALIGRGVDRATEEALRERGLDPAAHVARQFEPRMAESADVILTAETAHRDQVMTMAPSAFRRTFTLLEFSRIARHVAPGRGFGETVAAVAAARHLDGAIDDGRDDVPDPFGATTEYAHEILDLVSASIDAAAALLKPAASLGRRPSPGSRGPTPPRPRPFRR